MSEHHTFSVADAVVHGVNKAILLHNFRFWLGVNQRNNECQRDGATWTFLTSERISSAHAYMSQNSVKRWLSELNDTGHIIRQQFGRAGDRTYWYTMPDYMSKTSKFYPQQGHETNDITIAQNDITIAQNEPPLPKIVPSLRCLNKDTNTNTNNINNSDCDNGISFTQNLKNKIDEVMEKSNDKTIDKHKKQSVNLLPEIWIKKTFRWKGVTDSVEIFDVVDAFLLSMIASESDAKARNMYFVAYSLEKLTAKLSNWVSRHVNNRKTNAVRSTKYKKQPALSPAELHRAKNPEAFAEGAHDEHSYIEDL